ncbi:MAG: prepilin-type N-terminal cleavage/methylation domain-containing protein [Kiritimatiellia bacterium]|nr:prepilin-type N-terminal cleavage/methylation domain-containing protein [Kiritimatiellia bacterium]
MKKGFTLVEIMIVVAIIGLLAAIAIPSFMRARTTSQQNACINNLRQIEGAKDQYALEFGLTNLASIGTETVAMSNLVQGVSAAGGYIKTYPRCPASTNQAVTVAAATESYTVGVIGSNAACQKVSATHVLP